MSILQTDCCWRRAVMTDLAVNIIFEPRDVWIGVFFSKSKWMSSRSSWLCKMYIFPVPMLGLKITWMSW